jgi:hypothetical protein
MINRGEHIKSVCRKCIFLNDFVCSLRFIFLFFLIPVLSFSSVVRSDTTKQQYPLNDPRNPDCPCHKYQKLAEDEFNKGQHNENINSNNVIKNHSNNHLNINETDKTISQTDKTITLHDRRSFYKKKVLRKLKIIKKIKFKLLKGKAKIKITNTDYAECFRW